MDVWTQHLKWTFGILVGLLAASVLLIVIANPYGNLPLSPLGRHIIMDTNQRFHYPAIARSGRFDNLVIGTSTARLLEPRALGHAFGGRFANLALDSGAAWEQWQIERLFRRTVRERGTLIVGLDHVWCDAEADTRRSGFPLDVFPEWIYDDNPWNDFAYILNTRWIDMSFRRIGYALGLQRARWPEIGDGYQVFVPPEEQYDLPKVRVHIWGAAGPRAIKPQQPTFEANAATRSTWRYPALVWLEDMLDAKIGWQRIVLMFTPVHVTAQPQPGSEAAIREAECKARIRQLSKTYSVPFVDFRIASPLTTNDENYWDGLHVRVPVATRIVASLARALANGRADEDREFLVEVPTRQR